MRIIKNVILSIVLFGITPMNGFGQGQWVKLRKADKLYSYGKVNGSIFKYKSILEVDSTNVPANYELGRIYLLSKEDYPQSITYLSNAINHFSHKKDSIYMAYYYLAEAQKLMGNYSDAVKNFEYFQTHGVKNSTKGNIMKAEVSNKINECEMADSVFNGNSFNIVKVVNLGSDVNSDLSEYCSVYFTETNQLMYTARYQDHKRERKFLDLQYYESGYKIDNQTDNRVPELITINSEKLDRIHFSVVGKTFSGDTIIFYKDNKLWLSKMIDGELTTPVVFPEQINRSYYQPHGVFINNNTQFVFSSSEKKDFQLDLFISDLQEDGSWSEPVLFSDKINTPHNEDSPFFSEDGKTLYFSSNKPGGFGKYDVYKSFLVDGEWTEPENMGMPINSTGEDIFFTYNIDEETGFLSSNRGGGEGSMDIYMFTNKPYPSFDCEIFAHEFDTIDNVAYVEVLSDSYVNELMTFDASQSEFKEAELKNVFWKVDDEVLKIDLSELRYAFSEVGPHEVTAQVYAFNSSTQEYIMQCATVNLDIVVPSELFLQILADRTILEDSEMKLNAKVLNLPRQKMPEYDWYVDGNLVQEGDSIMNYVFQDTGIHLVTVKSVITDTTEGGVEEIEGFKEIYVYDAQNKDANQDGYDPGIVLNENKDPNTGRINALQADLFNVPNDKTVFYDWYINNNYLKGKNSSLLAYDFQPLDVVKVVGNVMNKQDELEFALEATKTIPNWGDDQVATNDNNQGETGTTTDQQSNNSGETATTGKPSLTMTDGNPSTTSIESYKANVTNAPSDATITYEWFVNGKKVEGASSSLLVRDFEPLDKVKVVSKVVGENETFTLESTQVVPKIPTTPLVDGNLNPVYFEFDKYSLTPVAKSTIDQNIMVLKANRSLKFRIEGNTDSMGASNYNIWLSRKRAKSVYNYLKANGIGDDQILGINANGEAKPKAQNRTASGKDNPTGRQTNRRVDFSIVQ